MSTNVGSLIESSNFKTLNITINGYIIENNYIEDLSIDWNSNFRIFGYFTLNDHFDAINSMFVEPGMLITIEYMDNYNKKFSRSFNLLASTETKEQNYKTIIFRFQDTLSWLLQKTYIPRSYKSTTLVDVFNDYFKLQAKSFADSYKIKVKSKPTLKLEHFVIPLHIDFLTFLENEFEREGVFFYQTKDSIMINTAEENNAPNDYPYVEAGNKDLYGFNIMEYDLTFNNIAETSKLQANNTLVFNKDTKSMVSYNKNLPIFMNEFSTGGIVHNSQLTNGEQLKTKVELIDTKKYECYLFNNNTTMHIIVPGNIDYSILWRKVTVELIGATYTIETRKSGDVILSGIYEISRVEDKFLAGQKFIQRLTLRRINQGKNTI